MTRSMPMSQKHQSWRRRGLAITATAGCAVAVGSAVVTHTRTRHQISPKPFQLQLPQPLVDAMAGAIGEVAQISLLYPLETIKVRCQSECLSAASVMRNMVSEHGISLGLARSLFSGFAAAAAFSVLVGSVHWYSFCSAKRAAMDVLPSLTGSNNMLSKTKTADSETEQLTATQGAHMTHVHVSSSHHTHEEGAVVDPAHSSDDLNTKTTANVVAAMVGAMCTALVEAPVELFRHQAQAGLISGNLVQEMARNIRQSGPFALWQGFLPFCLEAFPYDMCELGVYSQLRDLYDNAVKPGNRLQSVMRAIPEHAWDLAMGGAAGGVAVLLSMPFDCVKTYMQTHDLGGASLGARGQAALFFRTGMHMVKKRGLGALYMGVVPRLVQQVPSSTICWWAVQQTQKLLAPYTQTNGSSSSSMH